jgi:hypothetical protein
MISLFYENEITCIRPIATLSVIKSKSKYDQKRY